ncbi:uncharacterized protein Fot_43230 [Forsythia ovata]|uniref:Uncharacterized protein n=1 Tax=Forsythia ovata TaxID=205694 RepID=A0ABD1RQ94_9LAMI
MEMIDSERWIEAINNLRGDDFVREFVSKKRKLKGAKRRRDKFFAEVRIFSICKIQIKKSIPVEGERNCSAYDAAAGNSDAILATNSHMKSEDGGGQHQVLEKERRIAKWPKNGLTRDKAVDKRKISQA